jgi:general secretion pathway protein E
MTLRTNSEEETFDATWHVDQLIAGAVRNGASDIHIEPTAAGYDLRLRVDGLLKNIATHDAASGRSMVTRLMVMARLLTYRLDVPQEGRLVAVVAGQESPLEMRLAIMPTANGLRAAIRLPAELIQPRTLETLGLPEVALNGLLRFANADAGTLLVTGPAGSGKTTTIYALLEHIARHSQGLSIVTLEDPVERRLGGVTQIEVQPFGQLTYERALRSILRQDPQVLMLGEIRDAATATVAVQAALSGHRLVCTLHAGTPAGAIARLTEMGVEPYQITATVTGILNQRLVRKRCGDGYAGRAPIADYVELDQALKDAILHKAHSESLQQAIESQKSHTDLSHSARLLVQQGITDDAEVRRVLGERL